MKKIVGICLLLLSHYISFAQIQRTVEIQKKDTAKKESSPDIKNDSRKEILKELDLSKEQKIKLKEINQSMKSSKEAIENNKELSDAKRKKN